MYCLRQFIVVLPELHCLLQCLCYYCGMFIEKCVYTKFPPDWLLCEQVTRAVYVPIVMYGQRLFIVVLQELHCLTIFL